MTTEFILPDLLSKWPWPRRINPHYDACRDRAQTWIKDLEVLPPAVERGLNLCDPSLLAALAYPDMSSEQLCVACKLMYTFGVFDGTSDKMDADSVQAWVNIIKEVLAGESVHPTGEPVIGKLMQSFWSNASTVLGTTSQRRFISEFNTFTQSVVEQNQERGQFVLRDIEGFMKNRRHTVGARPAFALLEMDIEIPEDVFDSPPMVKLQALTVDMLCIANDIFSYNVEQASGDNHNLVTLLMVNKGMDLQTAIDYVATLHDQLVDEFLAVFNSLPSFGSPEVDGMVQSFVHGLGNWVRANEAWSFESMRYFGRDGPRVRLERRVELLAKANEAKLSMPNSPRIVPT